MSASARRRGAAEGADTIRAAARIVGSDNLLTADHDTAPFLTDWRRRYSGSALAVARPKTTEEVAQLVRLCRDDGIAVVPQGGNTGLTGGAVPRDGGGALVINVSRLDRIREIDARNDTMTVDAGCVLADVRAAASEAGRLFPMLLGSVGSCEIGGLVSTNAGGTGVLRYGNMRDLVLGLEVVLADGRVWDGLRRLRKDNTGYDLKQLFVGAEGTLGIVTGAVLKLFPKSAASTSAMVALSSIDDAVGLLHLMRAAAGSRIEAFEVMSDTQLQTLLRHRPDMALPLAQPAPWYVLIELADRSQSALDAIMEEALAEAHAAGLVRDAVIAASGRQADKIWQLRHNISEANKALGFSISNDTSVPISRIADLIERAGRRLATALPEATVNYVGHIGDGNIHVVVVMPHGTRPDAAAYEAAADVANTIVHEESVALGGSISAEHGIGLMHVDRLPKYKSALELDLMRGIKQALDPHGIMNPGKVLRQTPAEDDPGPSRPPASLA